MPVRENVLQGLERGTINQIEQCSRRCFVSVLTVDSGCHRLSSGQTHRFNHANTGLQSGLDMSGTQNSFVLMIRRFILLIQDHFIHILSTGIRPTTLIKLNKRVKHTFARFGPAVDVFYGVNRHAKGLKPYAGRFWVHCIAEPILCRESPEKRKRKSLLWPNEGCRKQPRKLFPRKHSAFRVRIFISTSENNRAT